MKNLILGLLALALLTGCTSVYKSRVPTSAFKNDENIIYVSDIQSIPKTALMANQQQALIQAKWVLPPEVWLALVDAMAKIANASTASYFSFRQDVAIVNREIYIRGITNAEDVKNIIDYLSAMPKNSIIDKR
jgi:hypothetical protein